MRTATVVLALLLALGGARADESPEARPAELASLLEPIRAKHAIPGMAGAVVRGDRLVAVGATGERAKGSAEPVTIEDRWHIGSCTKAMTATLLGRLAERGVLRFETTLAEAFPELEERMHAGYRDVTLAQLLGHRGGVPADLSADGLWARLWKHEGSPTEARRLLAESVLARPPAAEPGTKQLYSNAGYAIAGHVAERATRTPWEALMRRELFEPLGMKSAGFGAPGEAGAVDQPRGHREREGELVPVPPGKGADNPPAIGPAGTVHCTIGDWARFAALHLQGSRPGEDDLLLARETLRRIQTPLEGQSYALGWATAERGWGGGRVLNHAGSNTMWYAVVWLAPKRDLAVLVACNRAGSAAVKGCDAAAWALIRWAED